MTMGRQVQGRVIVRSLDGLHEVLARMPKRAEYSEG